MESYRAVEMKWETHVVTLDLDVVSGFSVRHYHVWTTCLWTHLMKEYASVSSALSHLPGYVVMQGEMHAEKIDEMKDVRQEEAQSVAQGGTELMA